MGTLTPGATYVYERVDNRIYAREVGKTERKMIGYDTDVFKKTNDRYFSLWNDILLEAEQNPALQQAVDKVIMLYRLSKDNPL
jgi:hypothetical protein